MKEWEEIARNWLDSSLDPIPQELNEIDWKMSMSPNKDQVAKHISAFANHHEGGFLAFGINDKSGKVVGLKKTESNAIVEQLANIARDALTPAVMLDHSVITYAGVPLLVIRIAESKHKPVHLNKTLEATYVRSGGTSRKATRQELGALMLNSRPLVWEKLHASSPLTGQDVLNALDYRKIFELLDRPIPSEANEILSWMEKEEMVVRDPGSGKFVITNFGAITAAYKLEDFEGLERKAIRVIKYKGKDKTESEREINGVKGYAIGFEGLIEFIMGMLPQSEIINHALRKEATIFPEIALREIIANAIIHQDFSITGTGPMVELFDNRIEVRNPGRLLASKKIDRLIGTNPESRNEHLAAALRRYNICEERGSGLIKVVGAIELWGLPPLKFEEGSNYFKATLYAPKTFAEMSPNERIEACYQHAVLKHLGSEAMTNASLRKRLKMSESQRPQVSKLIKEAMTKKRIKQKDPDNKSTKFSEYVPFWA